MIKAIGALFRTLLLLALIGLVGYNIFETRKLQAEVDLLRQQVAGKRARASSPLGRTEPDIGAVLADRVVPGWVKEAQAHVERARVFLRTKRYEEARAEAEQALSLARKNGIAAQKQSAETVQKWHQSAETVRAQATTLWKQIDRLARLPKEATTKQP